MGDLCHDEAIAPTRHFIQRHNTPTGKIPVVCLRVKANAATQDGPRLSCRPAARTPIRVFGNPPTPSARPRAPDPTAAECDIPAQPEFGNRSGAHQPCKQSDRDQMPSTMFVAQERRASRVPASPRFAANKCQVPGSQYMRGKDPLMPTRATTRNLRTQRTIRLNNACQTPFVNGLTIECAVEQEQRQASIKRGARGVGARNNKKLRRFVLSY